MSLQKATHKSTAQTIKTLQFDCLSFLSSRGCNHILVIMDESTGFCWFKPIVSMSANEIANHLNEFFKTYGIPKQISNDHSASLTSKVLANLTNLYGIKFTHDKVNKPSSTGLLESKMKLAKTLVDHMVLTQPNIEIHEKIADIAFYVNNPEKSSTG